MQYTSVIGQKFNEDGTVRPFPGNTIVCMMAPASAQWERVAWLQAQFAEQPFAQSFALLPPDSFHMTVMDLLCDQVRDPAQWSPLLPLAATLRESDVFVLKRVGMVPAPANFRMVYQGLSTSGGLRIDVVPADDATHRAIRGYRDAVTETTSIRFPNHEEYGFHISLAYRLIEMEDGEEEEIDAWVSEVNPILRETFGLFETGQPFLAFFDDMARFVSVDGYRTLRTR